MFVTGINFSIINKSIPKKNKSYNKYKNYKSINENDTDINENDTDINENDTDINTKIGKTAKCINKIKNIILYKIGFIEFI